MSILTTQPDKLRGRAFQFDAGLDFPGGRVEVWEQPVPNMTYVIGADGALGIEGRDYDAACVLIKGDGLPRQVAEVHGHWGETFDRLLYALGTFYNTAFIGMEAGGAANGLPTLRRLWNEYGYEFIRFDRDPKRRAQPILDKLGYSPVHNDLVIRDLRRRVQDGQVILRSPMLLDQMERLQWKPMNEARDMEDRVGDARLQMKLPGGGSPDLVMACAFALQAWEEVVHYEPPKTKYAPDTLGHILEHEKYFPTKAPQVATFGLRRDK